jgi:serine/threonine protein kinase/Tol biopolymer transport system component
MALASGDRIGVYDVIAQLGAGGMGEVYRARDTRLKRDVALKILSGSLRHDVERLARFRREAEVLARLNHPNIASIYGVETAGSVDALVLELVEGPTLADRLARGPLPVAQAVAIARQIAEALDAAHERGIVHRDLKPANIKVREDGTVKVLDFGLAKAIDHAGESAAAPSLTDSSTPTSASMTEIGVILGTAAYMSPEQARAAAVDKRTDIWAFGCVLYELLAGRAAFGGPTVSDTIAAILERTPNWSALPATTPPGLRSLIERCLEKDRRRRLRDIGDARTDLDRLEAGPDSALGVRSPSGLRWFLGVAMLTLAAVAVAGLFRMSGNAGSGASSSSAMRLTRLTSDVSFSTEPVLSRDGTLVVYASDREGAGQLDLWLRRTTGGPYLRLTHHPADDREPDISPDGSTIAFRSDRDGGGVYVMPVLGGDARLVAPGGRQPRFSPDGKQLVFAVPGSWLSGPTGSPSALFVMAATGGPATRLAEGLTIGVSPVWSPDGGSVLVLGGPSQDAIDWWWVPVDGRPAVATGAYGALKRAGLAGRAGNDLSAVPGAWTRNGVHFSARLGDGVNLWRLQISGRSGLVDEASLERLTYGAGADVEPSADDLGRIAFQVADDVGESLTLPLDPNAGKVTGHVMAHTFEAGEGPGRSSLDDGGRLLAYPRGRGTELWVKDLSTASERHVLTAPAIANPIISHDGSTVAYGEGGGRLDGLPGTRGSGGYVVSVSGGTPRKVCDSCVVWGWFADNRRVLTFEWDEGASVGRARAIDTATLTTYDLIETRTPIGRLDLSPDERWLVFGEGGTFRLAPVRSGLPASQREWVTVFERTPGSAERPCGWSPDGRLLYLLLERDGFRDLYAQRIEGATGTPAGAPFEVAHFHDPRRRWGSTSFGSAIVRNAFVFTQVETTGSIWLLEAK